MQGFDKMDASTVPDMAAVDQFVGSPLWQEVRDYCEGRQGAVPKFEYSRCAVPGWNVKYRKGGRALCTLYPDEGRFICLVAIGQRELPAFELLLPTLDGYTREYYDRFKDKSGGCWLMLEVDRPERLRDAIHCMELRRKTA